MGKLTKQQSKLHQQAMDLIYSDSALNFEQKEFILDNYHGDAVGATGAFFTPNMLSWDFTLEVMQKASIVDLCAGIGRLSFSVLHRCKPTRLVCVELNQEYCNIGKRVLPKAEWICMDVLKYSSTERFDQVIGNPPFGRIFTSTEMGIYRGTEFEFKVITHGSTLANYGSFIVPQGSAGFVYSGARYYDKKESSKYSKWVEQTGLELDAGVGIDTSIYREEWHGTNVITEVVNVQY